MEAEQEYKIQEFCEVLHLKESRTKELLKALVVQGKIETIGSNKDRRYKLGDLKA